MEERETDRMAINRELTAYIEGRISGMECLHRIDEIVNSGISDGYILGEYDPALDPQVVK